MKRLLGYSCLGTLLVCCFGCGGDKSIERRSTLKKISMAFMAYASKNGTLPVPTGQTIESQVPADCKTCPACGKAWSYAKISALLRAGPARLRPVLMTTFALVFGMLPIALGTGEGSETRAPMAIAVIGGLTASTLLTLVVVPVVYALLDDAQRLVGLGKGGRSGA